MHPAMAPPFTTRPPTTSPHLIEPHTAERSRKHHGVDPLHHACVVLHHPVAGNGAGDEERRAHEVGDEGGEAADEAAAGIKHDSMTIK